MTVTSQETIVLLPYQQEAENSLVRHFEQANKALMVMATGLGKTVIAATWCKKELQNGPGLFLCHNTGILEHAIKEFQNILGEGFKLREFHGNKKEFELADILFATFQTMQDWKEVFYADQFSFLIVDESHHGQAPTFREVIEYFKPRKLLGMTATPDRADLLDIRDIFGQEVINLPLEEAIARGFLPEIEYHVILDNESTLAEVAKEIEIIDKPLTRKDINKRFFVRARDIKVAEIIESYDKKTIIFCKNIAHTLHFSQFLQGAEVYHSDQTANQNRQVLKDLNTGIIKRVLAVNAFNEGLHPKNVDVVVFLRDTQSPTIVKQQIGRGLSPGKEKLIILDFVANIDRIEMLQNLMNEIAERHEKCTSPEDRKKESYRRDRFHLSGKGFEFIFSDTIVNVMKRRGEIKPAPEGWMTENGLAAHLGKHFGTIKRKTKAFRTSHPTWFQIYLDGTGKAAEHYSPELCEVLRRNWAKQSPAPESWLTNRGLAEELKRGEKTISDLSGLYRQDHPEWFSVYLDKGGRFCEHLAPELCDILRNHFTQQQAAPDGWMTNNALAEQIMRNPKTVKKTAEAFRTVQPEWFQSFQSKNGVHEYYAPQLCLTIKTQLTEHLESPNEWQVPSTLAKELGVSAQFMMKTASTYRQVHPEWFCVYLDKKKRPFEHLAPELCDVLRKHFSQRQVAPEGWFTSSALATILGRSPTSISSWAQTFRQTNPEWFKQYLDAKGRLFEHYSPELCKVLREKSTKNQ